MGFGGAGEEMRWDSGGLWWNWGGDGVEQCWAVVEQRWAVVELRRRWSGAAVGCSGTEEEVEWSSGGLWWGRGGNGVKQ